VAGIELAIAGDAMVDHPPVQSGQDFNRSRPIVSFYRAVDGGQVVVLHVDETLFGQCRDTSEGIFEADSSFEDPMLDVQRLVEHFDFDAFHLDPVTAVKTELQAEPVGEIDEVFVFDYPAGNFCSKAVVPARQVGAGIVDVVRVFFGKRAPRCEIAVSERAEGLPQSLLFGVV